MFLPYLAISSSTWIGKLVLWTRWKARHVCFSRFTFWSRVFSGSAVLQLPSTIEPVNSSLWSASKRHTPHEPENSKIHLHLPVASSEFERLPRTPCSEFIRWRCLSMFEYDIAWLSANDDYGSYRNWFHDKLNENHNYDLDVSARKRLDGCFLQNGTSENEAPGSSVYTDAASIWKSTLRMLSLHWVKHKEICWRHREVPGNRSWDVSVDSNMPLSIYKVHNMIFCHFTPHFIIFHHHILCYQAVSPPGQVFPNPHLAVYIDQFSPWLHDPTASTPRVRKWCFNRYQPCGSCMTGHQFQTFLRLSNISQNHKINQNHRPRSWCLRKVVASTEQSLQTRQFFTESMLKDIQEMIRTGAM